ncbi:MAG: PIN domain-containing protein [Undibacterium sp.]|nr:PIN domain-containing protein [Opitutaceae bacterium]
MRGADRPLVARFVTAFDHVRASSIVVAELEYGAVKSGVTSQRTRLDALRSTLPLEPFTLADAAEFGRLRTLLARRGELIGPYDLLIAAQALRLGATLITHNLREFSRVPGLKIEDWQSA